MTFEKHDILDRVGVPECARDDVAELASIYEARREDEMAWRLREMLKRAWERGAVAAKAKEEAKAEEAYQRGLRDAAYDYGTSVQDAVLEVIEAVNNMGSPPPCWWHAIGAVATCQAAWVRGQMRPTNVCGFVWAPPSPRSPYSYYKREIQF